MLFIVDGEQFTVTDDTTPVPTAPPTVNVTGRIIVKAVPSTVEKLLKVIDPLYVPYQRTWIPELQQCMNTWSKMGPDSNINPEQVKFGRRSKFQRKHSFYPCPPGYTGEKPSTGGEGFCMLEKPENELIFYTDKWRRPISYEAKREVYTHVWDGKTPYKKPCPYVKTNSSDSCISPISGTGFRIDKKHLSENGLCGAYP